jgi:alkanesulfonate monooxygenase SsuD/methylene tetrahydromethanopterin reductase-like flavin-dependent oxidoreductase (luciferase family)
VTAEAGLAVLSSHLGIDLSPFPLDAPLCELKVDGGTHQAMVDRLAQFAGHDRTLREAVRKYGMDFMCPQIAGTPEQVATHLQGLFESGCADGFVLTPILYPDTIEAFVRGVVPILQERGVYRKDYAASTLRGNLNS